jgi:hypothetical protein
VITATRLTGVDETVRSLQLGHEGPVALGVGGRAVAVQGAAAVGAHGGEGGVGVERDGPAPLVNRDQMVEPAEHDQVDQLRVVAPGAPADVWTSQAAVGCWQPGNRQVRSLTIVASAPDW